MQHPTNQTALGKGIAIAGIWLGSLGICAFSPGNALAVDIFAIIGTVAVALNF